MMKTVLIFLVGVCVVVHVLAISGGENTTIETYPYVVRFKTLLLECMGFIVTDKYVVTGAQCTTQCLSNITTACACKLYAGATERDDGLPFDIKYMVEHENFDKVTVQNNVAIVQIRDKFIFNSTVQPIPYPIFDLAVDTTVYIVGWGFNKIVSTYASTLQSAELKITNHTVCVDSYAPTYKVTNNMTCASAPNKDACIGDGGGALIYKNATGPLAAGIIFFTENPCGNETSYPVITTNMSSVSSWITNKIAELDLCTNCSYSCPPSIPPLLND